jgi:hypothetical protein
LVNFITYIILDKKVKYNYKNLDLDRFSIYYNNLCWTLVQYKILDNQLNYIQDSNKSNSNTLLVKSTDELLTDELSEELNNISTFNSDNIKKDVKKSKSEIILQSNREDSENKIRIRNVINIFNFINYNYN